MDLNRLKHIKTFEGFTSYYEYDSPITKTKMKFSIYRPSEKKVTKAIIWLSGLTCTEENFITKAGAQSLLTGTDTMIICPDTSPRGLDLPNEHESYDFGSGAGFYINSKTDGYKDHYQMYDYIKDEIVSILKNEFKVQDLAISGHSMGGHGALILGLREPSLFKSVSAFSPITNPMACPWGEKAFKGYLGEDWKDHASEYDATELVLAGNKRNDTLLIDQGLNDEFYPDQLQTSNFEKACEKSGQKLTVKYREGFDHSYFYIASFIQDHINFHLKALS